VKLTDSELKRLERELSRGQIDDIPVTVVDDGQPTGVTFEFDPTKKVDYRRGIAALGADVKPGHYIL